MLKSIKFLLEDRPTDFVSTPASGISPRSRFSSVILPLATLVVALSITLLMWRAYDNSLKARSKTVFQDKTARISDSIIERMRDHEEVLRGAAGLFSVKEDVSRADWLHYVAALQLDKNHPGILGVGFTKWLTPAEKDANVRQIRAEGFSDYTIRPEGKRPVYTSIIYLEPFNWRNQRAFGYDMYSEPLRRSAMDKARDENIATIAAKIILVQETDTDKQSGMLMYMPVYKHGMPLDNVEQRRSAFIGFAYSPIRMNDFVGGTLEKLPRDIAFDISIIGNQTADGLMFNSVQAQKLTLPEKYQAAITSSTTIQAYGSAWQFSFKTLPDFNKELNQEKSYMVLAAGIIISALFSCLIFLILKTRNQAIKLANEMILSLNNRLSLAADSAQIGVWDWLVTENQLIWDKWMYVLYGVREEDFSSSYQAWQSGLHPDDRARCDEGISLALRGVREFNTEFRVVWPSGEVRHIKANALVLRDAGGIPFRMIGVNYDITERKRSEELVHEQAALLELEVADRQRAQEALAVKQLQLEALNNSLQERISEALAELRQRDQMLISQSRQAAMGEMIGNIAHQWRQPLNALSMLLANIQMAHLYNEITADFMKSVLDKGNTLIQKMSTTINDFRNFFLPDKESVSFSANSQINHALSLVGAGLNSQNIQIQLEAECEMQMTGLPNEYSQVILNLLSNAREAIKENNIPEGIIKIRLFERDGFACAAVSDNGGGIPADVIDKIFEPYFSTKEMGTGIGLYMSKMIIERSMKGTIEARNIDGGAEFVVSIPQGETL